mgnify:CR=1 FL=1
MAGNPYTESGEKFRIPDMLANRADTYNLGDEMKGREAAFRGSYLENAVTSNKVLSPLGKAAQKDIQAFIKMAETRQREGIELEGNFSPTQVEELIGQGASSPSGHIPFTPRAKKVLELSLREALQLGHNYIGTEHILLGLIREGEGVAAQVLVKLGADLSRVRQQVIQLLSGYSGSGQGSSDSPDKAGATAGGRGGDSPSGSLVLDQFGRNLTQAARDKKLDPVIGRHRETERVMQVLSRRTKNNPVLVLSLIHI